MLERRVALVEDRAETSGEAGRVRQSVFGAGSFDLTRQVGERAKAQVRADPRERMRGLARNCKVCSCAQLVEPIEMRK